MIKKIKTLYPLLEKHWVLITILLVGLFLRSYQPLARFQYSHDQDLAGWIIRDVLFNHHFRLIGQETSSHGIFIGPYFYYLQIPFYLLTRMDPAGALLLPIILGMFTIWSIYFVLAKIFEERVGLIGSFIYSLSVVIIFTDREIAPTMPVMLWTIWFLFSISEILRKKQYGYIILGFLVGLIWSISLQLVILMPLVLLAQIFSRKKIDFKKLFIGVLIAIVLNVPFVAFELRHGFQQTRSLVSSLTTSKDYIAGTAQGFFPKLDRTMQLVYRNSTNIFGMNVLNVRYEIAFWGLVVVLGILIWKKKISPRLGSILFLWIFIYILFFTKISLNISEYYLNGMNVVYILITSVGLNQLLKGKLRFKINNLRLLGTLALVVFVLTNIYSFFARPINASGYIERKEAINYIKEDAKAHNYPCVSLSFITSPGNNLGYRYFTAEANLKTKPISKNVPVYSIVFPQSLVDSFDKGFGAIGVVKPDYKRYNIKTIQSACAGDDYTLTQPMFGFTN